MTRRDLIHHANFLQAFSFTRMVEAFRPQYLHSYFFYDRSLMALVAAYLLSIPRGISCYADHHLRDYELKLVPLHLELCDIIVATSSRIKQELLDIAPATDPNRILVKPNAVDGEHFGWIERHDPLDGEPFRLTCVSRIEPKKGLVYLIDAVHILRDRQVPVELHIVGEADRHIQSSLDYKRELDAHIERRGLWGIVHLEGRKTEAEVRHFLGMAQLFVAPFVETGSGDRDGIPTALMESMATGLPAVTTDAGSIEEVVENGVDGMIVPQRDPLALAEAIERLLRDPLRRIQMGWKGYEKIRARFEVRECESPFHERVLQSVRERGLETREIVESIR